MKLPLNEATCIHTYLVGTINIGKINNNCLATSVFISGSHFFCSKNLIWSVPQPGVLHTNEGSVVQHPYISRYLVKAYNMVNHVILISQRFVPLTAFVGPAWCTTSQKPLLKIYP